MSEISSTAGIAAAWSASKAAQTQQAVQSMALKSQAQSEQAVVQMIEEVASQAPAPAGEGLGANVDIRV